MFGLQILAPIVGFQVALLRWPIVVLARMAGMVPDDPSRLSRVDWVVEEDDE